MKILKGVLILEGSSANSGAIRYDICDLSNTSALKL